MTDEERYCTVYAVPNNRPVIAGRKPEKKPLSAATKARWDFMNSYNFILYTDENGNACGRMEPKEQDCAEEP